MFVKLVFDLIIVIPADHAASSATVRDWLNGSLAPVIEQDFLTLSQINLIDARRHLTENVLAHTLDADFAGHVCPHPARFARQALDAHPLGFTGSAFG